MLLDELGVPAILGTSPGDATTILMARPFEEDPEDEGLADAFAGDDDEEGRDVDDDLDDDDEDDDLDEDADIDATDDGEAADV